MQRIRYPEARARAALGGHTTPYTSYTHLEARARVVLGGPRDIVDALREECHCVVIEGVHLETEAEKLSLLEGTVDLLSEDGGEASARL